MKFTKISLIAIICLSITSCSAGFVYRNLDWIIPWYADDYFDFNDQQEEEFQRIVDKGITWHKETELPRYVEFIQPFIDQGDQPFSDAQISEIENFSRSAFMSIQELIMADLLALFRTMSDEQQENYWQKMEERQNELEEKYLTRTEKEYREEIKNSYIESLEEWLGPLSDDQEAKLSQLAMDHERNDQGWLQARKLWTKDLKNQYERKQVMPESEWIEMMRKAVFDREKFESDLSKQTGERNEERATRVMLEVVNSRSKRQSEHLQDFLKGWQNKFKRWQTE